MLMRSLVIEKFWVSNLLRLDHLAAYCELKHFNETDYISVLETELKARS